MLVSASARSSASASVSLAGGGNAVQAGCGTAVGELVEDAGGDGLGRQLVERVDTDDREHRGDGVAVRADVAGGKG